MPVSDTSCWRHHFGKKYFAGTAIEKPFWPCFFFKLSGNIFSYFCYELCGLHLQYHRLAAVLFVPWIFRNCMYPPCLFKVEKHSRMAFPWEILWKILYSIFTWYSVSETEYLSFTISSNCDREIPKVVLTPSSADIQTHTYVPIHQGSRFSFRSEKIKRWARLVVFLLSMYDHDQAVYFILRMLSEGIPIRRLQWRLVCYFSSHCRSPVRSWLAANWCHLVETKDALNQFFWTVN